MSVMVFEIAHTPNSHKREFISLAFLSIGVHHAVSCAHNENVFDFFLSLSKATFAIERLLLCKIRKPVNFFRRRFFNVQSEENDFS